MNIIYRHELGSLIVDGAIPQTVGEDVWEAQTSWSMLIVVPLVEMIETELFLGLHANIEDALGGGHGSGNCCIFHLHWYRYSGSSARIAAVQYGCSLFAVLTFLV